MYQVLSRSSYSLDIPLMTGLSSDELKPSSMSYGQSYIQMHNNQLDPTMSTTNSFWTDSYQVIYVANSILEGISKYSGMSEAAKLQYSGEAKFVRAFCYFYLVNFFGDVPLVLETNYKVTGRLPRLAKEDVYEQIEKDLIDAENGLMDGYPSSGRVRANRWVAKAFLARVHLYQGKWEEALRYANEVIGNEARYKLGKLDTFDSEGALISMMDIFKADNEEAIWQFWNEYGSSLGGYTISPYYWTCAVADGFEAGLLEAFEAGDLRKKSYIQVTEGSGSESKVNKYRLYDRDPDYEEYTMVLRLSEQYFIRAEALTRLDFVKEGLLDLNTIRDRAGLQPFSLILDKESVLEKIEKERRVELCFEWGDRWLNLKRLGTLDAVMKKAKPTTWRSTAALYPIPFQEFLSNRSLTQNPGYSSQKIF
jgi:hypothetical protein